MSVSSYRVELGPVAEEDAERAFRSFLERNPPQAVEWYDGLVDIIESLSRHPERCARAPEDKRRRRGIRQLLYRRGDTTFRILFVVKKEQKLVHVLRIRHGARRRLRRKDLFVDAESRRKGLTPPRLPNAKVILSRSWKEVRRDSGAAVLRVSAPPW